jgi:hypothetical protein
MNFREASAIPVDDEFYSPELTQVLVDSMLENAPLLSVLEFYQIIGNAENKRRQSTATGGVFRAEGSDYTAAATAPDYVSPVLRVFGDRYRVDQAFVRRGLDIPSLVVRDVQQLGRNLAFGLVNQIITGTGTAPQFFGIRNLVPTLQTTEQGVNGAILPNGNSDANRATQQVFFETLDRAIAMTRPGKRFLLAPDRLISRMTNVWREAFSFTDDPVNAGRRLLTYMGVPIISAGYDEAGNEIMPFNEPLGTSTNCSSIYCVATGEEMNYSIATNSGFGVSLSKVGVFHEGIAEADLAPTSFDNKAIARFRGIRLV